MNAEKLGLTVCTFSSFFSFVFYARQACGFVIRYSWLHGQSAVYCIHPVSTNSIQPIGPYQHYDNILYPVIFIRNFAKLSKLRNYLCQLFMIVELAMFLGVYKLFMQWPIQVKLTLIALIQVWSVKDYESIRSRVSEQLQYTHFYLG